LPKVIITIGLPGSGKTTWALDKLLKDGNTVRVNRDSLRDMMFGGHWTREREVVIRRAEIGCAQNALAAGYNVIVDDTNLPLATQRQWSDFAKAQKAEFLMKHMNTSLQDCIRQDAKRVGKQHLGRAIIENMALKNGLIKIENEFVIFDIDGTLSDLDHRLPWLYDQPKKDWYNFYGRVILDKAKPEIVNWLKGCYADGWTVLVVSGRPTQFKDLDVGVQTERWLRLEGIPYHHLFMRSGDDHRDDTLVKQDILSMLPKEKLQFVVDDRKRVCDMWRANGVKTYQIAKGDY
jgi:predicted kinase